MKRIVFALMLAWTGAAQLAVAENAAVVPLPQAHAHNDYEHARPLFDALDHGFCSIEADIWLVDDQLLVAHDFDKVSPERTLQGLYLDPLLERSMLAPETSVVSVQSGLLQMGLRPHLWG